MKEKLETLPSLPGVYFFKDKHHQINYIGKAKSLKNRVKSYFQKTNDWKVQALLEASTDIDYVITNSEIEAMLLEAELIQEHKPKFNVLLKSGQPFVYIVITKESLPTIKVVRNKEEKGIYFGPFLHKRQARSVVNFLLDTFRLKLCNKKIEHGCLDYHLELCAGSCKTNFDTTDYLFRIELVRHLLSKDHKNFLAHLNAQIKEKIDALEFEKARSLHKFVINLDTIFNTLEAKYSHDKYHHDLFIATNHVKKLEDYRQLSVELQQFFHTERPIITIDCFDISHFQSSYIVGSSVRFCNGFPDKQNFRRFKIKSLQEQNDYAALQEIVTRRYRDAKNIPDLILIDGGKGQLQAVNKLVPNALFVSLAKREERLFTPLHPDGIKLDVATAVGKTLIALRDYAHHFAISYHKLLRHKRKSS